MTGRSSSNLGFRISNFQRSANNSQFAIRNSPAKGFTLLELMIVISIIIILVSVALPQYQKTIMHTRETILSYDLDTMRKLLDQYAADKGKLPQSLDDLVTAGYMRDVPKDPITDNKTGILSPATIRTRLKAVLESPMCIALRAKSQPLEPRTANGENQ